MSVESGLVAVRDGGFRGFVGDGVDALLVSRNVDEARGSRAIGMRNPKFRCHVRAHSLQLEAHHGGKREVGQPSDMAPI